MKYAANTVIAILVRNSNVDNNNWGQLINVESLHVDSGNRLAWDGDGHSTRITNIVRNLNMVRVYTRSGAEYSIVFPLVTHGKAEWREAQKDAMRLADRLQHEYDIATYWS